jgi:hypothetical protein
MKGNCSDTYFCTKKIIHCSNIHSACDLSMDPLMMNSPTGYEVLPWPFPLSTSFGGLYGF